MLNNNSNQVNPYILKKAIFQLMKGKPYQSLQTLYQNP